VKLFGVGPFKVNLIGTFRLLTTLTVDMTVVAVAKTLVAVGIFVIVGYGVYVLVGSEVFVGTGVFVSVLVGTGVCVGAEAVSVANTDSAIWVDVASISWGDKPHAVANKAAKMMKASS
jgi:hypothetical protein